MTRSVSQFGSEVSPEFQILPENRGVETLMTVGIEGDTVEDEEFPVPGPEARVSDAGGLEIASAFLAT